MPGKTGVCVLGSFMMDLVADAPRRPERGETLAGTRFDIVPGGKGLNQAVAAARAGTPTAMVGRLGADDFGATFRRLMEAEGIDQTSVLTDPELGTGVGMPLVEPDGQNSIVIIPRSNLAITPADIRAAAPAIQSAAVLLVQFELPIEASLEAARLAYQVGTAVIVNPAPFSPIPGELVELAAIIAPNENELQAWRGQTAEDLESLRTMAAQAARETATDVVVTVGSRGVLVAAQGQDVVHVPPCAVTAVDTVGAGDVFCANLAASIARGERLDSAVQVANAAAALAITRRGGATTAPRLAETQAFVDALGLTGRPDRIPGR